MLFNSNAFVFVFLPVVLVAFFGLRHAFGVRPALAFLLAASLFFYGWWNPAYLVLITASIAFNFAIGRGIERSFPTRTRARNRLLACGVVFDLGLLGYFKYVNFFIANVEALAGRTIGWSEIALPIAISFFTFQQIAYLVDTWRGERSGGSLLDYAVFVSFFPQLIAGPIVHHRELLPQLADEPRLRFSSANLSVGLTIFSVGLFKKTVIADGMATFATPVFAAAEGDAALLLVDAWGAALAYTFQIYFDFSGYSDMAIGLARMFGLQLPINFESPYKATSIVDFWRRWHITLSRFLRDYLYIPLGGNRSGEIRRYANLWLTMLLGGLWHGAGWGFLVWGGLHGCYLVVNHLWRALRRSPGKTPTRGVQAACIALTFALTVVTWVPFRAETGAGTERMLTAMFAPEAASAMKDVARWTAFEKAPNGSGAGLRVAVDDFSHSDWRFWLLEPFDLALGGAWWIALCMLIVWGLPNTRQWMADYEPGIESYPQPPSRWSVDTRIGRWAPGWRWHWRPGVGWALLTSVLAFASIIAIQGKLSEFIYFQF